MIIDVGNVSSAPATATFDASGLYRYRLTRGSQRGSQSVAWVMLNPSTADATAYDPTIRRVVGLTRSWGYHSLVVVNLFALRSPSPQALLVADDPVGPLNDQILERAAARAELVVVAWGNGGALHGRARVVAELLSECTSAVSCLGQTASGQPRHPLYLPASVTPLPWAPAMVPG